MDCKNFSKDQLLDMAYDVGLHDKELNKEWHKRYGLNFPYALFVMVIRERNDIG